MIEHDKTSPLHALCFACKVFHPKTAFTEAMLRNDMEDRICMGRTLALPVCEHVALHYHHGQVHVNGDKLALDDYKK